MSKRVVFLWVMFCSLSVRAQFSMSVQLPPGGLVQKEQLWNLVIINNARDVAELTLQLHLQDAQSGQVVFSAVTGKLVMGKGAKMIKVSDVQPVSYSYVLSDFAANYLPMGAYLACYQLISSSDQKEIPVAEECVRINIDPLSPPILSSPSDKSVVSTPYPQFLWMPPTPFEMFSSLSYDLLVTEVLPGQSPAEAIQMNTPVYSKTELRQPYESYASSFARLDTGKLYAWQVVARNGMNYAAKTEVWTFRVAPPSWVQLLIEQTPFIKMRRDNPEKGIAPNGILKLSYTNETTDSVIVVHLLDLSSSTKQETAFELKVSRGENLIQQDVRKLLQAKEGTVYEAYILNSRKERWRMLFEVHEYNDKKVSRD